jgi:hypothetical protein
MKAQRETAPFAWCRRQQQEKRLLLGKGAARQRHAKRQRKAANRKHAAVEVLGSDDGERQVQMRPSLQPACLGAASHVMALGLRSSRRRCSEVRPSSA